MCRGSIKYRRYSRRSKCAEQDAEDPIGGEDAFDGNEIDGDPSCAIDAGPFVLHSASGGA